MIDMSVSLPRLFAEGTGNLQLATTIQAGSITAVVGPSGSGKTTLLRLLAGLETPADGRIVVEQQVWLDRKAGVNLPPQQRSIGYVFQDTALFPNMSVRENIQYAAPQEAASAIDELVEATGLSVFSHKKPTVLSGGQRQRVALARALVRRPRLLLLDEPFSALDADSADQLRQLVLTLHRAWKTTTILVSHHEADVRALADRVIRLEEGSIQDDQVATIPTPSVRHQIRQIWFDQVHQQWVVETDTVQLRSTDAQWAELKVGAYLDLTWS